MNRPFPAFAALLILMTLAVVALSTSSRSTTVGSAPPRKAVSVRALDLERLALEEPARGGPAFVFVIAGSEAALEGLSGEEEIESVGEVAGDDELLDEANLDNANQDQATRRGPVTRLKSATVTALEPIFGEVSAVETSKASESRGAGADLAHLAWPVSADEVMAIFEELHARTAVRSTRQNIEVAPVYRWFQSSRVALAARLWLVQQLRRLVEELPLFSQLAQVHSADLAWSEYAEMMDRAIDQG